MRFVVLGIHGSEVKTVEGDVARVRMFIDGMEEPVDEDFPLPSMLPGVTPTMELYQYLITSAINARMVELGGVDPGKAAEDRANAMEAVPKADEPARAMEE